MPYENYYSKDDQDTDNPPKDNSERWLFLFVCVLIGVTIFFVADSNRRKGPVEIGECFTYTNAYGSSEQECAEYPIDDSFDEYENCDAVRADGADPIYEDDPGFGSHLDRDGDGVGCEPWYGN